MGVSSQLPHIPGSLRCRFAVFALALCRTPAGAAVPEDAAERAKTVGQPTALVVQPETITLPGPRAKQQIVVTGKYADGSVRDLTAFAELSVEGGVASLYEGGYLMPRKNGAGALVVKAGGQTVRVAARREGFRQAEPRVSFRREVIAALNVGGCNAGACHGTPRGKNGFKLSLRGFDPAADYLQLTRDVLGRRTDRHRPRSQPDPAEGAGPGAARGRPALPAEQRPGPDRCATGWPRGCRTTRQPARRSRASRSCPARAC